MSCGWLQEVCSCAAINLASAIERKKNGSARLMRIPVSKRAIYVPSRFIPARVLPSAVSMQNSSDFVSAPISVYGKVDVGHDN